MRLYLTKRQNVYLLAAFFIGIFSATTSNAMLYDPAADFSTAGNPNGPWSYGWSFSLASSLTYYTQSGIGANGIGYWNDPAHLSLGAPSVAHNETENPITSWPENITWQPGQFALHPGPNGEYSHAVWTAPAAGMFNISGIFAGIDRTNTTTDVHVLLNGVSLFDGLVNGYGSPSPFALENVSIGKDGTIDFAVGYGSNHSFWDDSTSLSATIHSVPLPPALFLFGPGLVGLVGNKMRSRKR